MRARMRLAGLEGSYHVRVGLTTAAGTAAVLLIGVSHVRSGLLTLGELLMVMGYLNQLYQPLKTISQKAATLQLHLASAERAFALLDEPSDVGERPEAQPLARARGAVAFRNVSFAYGPERPVLHEISFDIEPGTRLGIVGASGAGKSTLISLLTRFYDPSQGQILLDGVDLRDFRLEDLRRQFALVPQDPVLFATSIAENIAYARPGASQAERIAAAQAANAHEFIIRLPQGYDTQVGERGVQLSGGQRQRIAIARAFLKDSPVLILDEPTSSVDMETEAVIVEALERLQQGRTVIIISHRPTTLAGCSALLMIEQGRVVRDTTRALPETGAIQPTPKRAPALAATGSRLESLLAHPAVQAWRRLGPDRPGPAPGAAAPGRRGGDRPDAGPGRYRKQMYTARDLFRNHLDHPAFTADDLAFLDGLLARFDQLDEHWDRLEQVATGLPRTLLHGDFNGKNLRVQASPAGPQIAAFDWTDAGRGVPTADLAQVVFATIGFSASPDLATYLSVVRERWPDCDPEDVERLAACGTVFRDLAAIDWDSQHFFPDWANWFVPNLKLYDAELVHALDRLGWPRRAEWA